MDYCMANRAIVLPDHPELWTKTLQKSVSAHISHVHHLDWIAVLFGCLDDYYCW